MERKTLSRRYFIISVIKHIAVVMSEKSRRRNGDNETDGGAHFWSKNTVKMEVLNSLPLMLLGGNLCCGCSECARAL